MPVATTLLGVETEIIEAICSVASVVTVVVSLLYVSKQVRLLRDQTQHLNASLHSQTYQAIYDKMISIDQFFVDHPHIKSHVYGDLDWPEDADTQCRVMSACEMLADLFQKLVQLHGQTKIDRANWLGWNRYMRTIYHSSPSFRNFIDKNGWWYTLDLASLLAAPAAEIKLPCNLQIDHVEANVLDCDSGFWAIYGEAFPGDEKEPKDVILKTISERRGAVLRARYCSDHYNNTHTIGLAVVHELESPRCHFLVYLAVARSARGHGVGPKLLDQITSRPRRFGSGTDAAVCTVIEVDNPAEANDTAERDRRTARVAFFEKAGFRILFQEYWQPALGDGKKPVHMFLMVAGKSIPDVKDLVRAIYREKYGRMNGVSDQLLDQLLNRSFSKRDE